MFPFLYCVQNVTIAEFSHLVSFLLSLLNVITSEFFLSLKRLYSKNLLFFSQSVDSVCYGDGLAGLILPAY